MADTVAPDTFDTYLAAVAGAGEPPAARRRRVATGTIDRADIVDTLARVLVKVWPLIPDPKAVAETVADTVIAPIAEAAYSGARRDQILTCAGTPAGTALADAIAELLADRQSWAIWIAGESSDTIQFLTPREQVAAYLRYRLGDTVLGDTVL